MSTDARVMSIEDLEARHTSGLYTKRPIALVRGEGARVWDSEGREYIDCVGGQGAANIGHANPAVAAALADQARRLISCPEMFPNDRRAQLMAKLVEIAPDGLDLVFLCNSGTEAVEAALKFARVATRRAGVVAAKRAFHGRTIGSLSATWEKKYREPFEPLLPEFTHVSYNDRSGLESAISDRTGAVILEVVQGEGGVRPATEEFLKSAERLCRERGAMLIIDEVQTGFGRTGKMFACEHTGVIPDAICLAKSIAGGVPMGAVLFGQRIGKLPPLVHGTTFGGNPLACAAALAAIEFMIREDLPGRAARHGAAFVDRLRQIKSPLIREVRGLGLIVGVEVKAKAAPYLRAMMDRGVLALNAGPTVLRFLPPLVITEPMLDRVVEVVEEALATTSVGGDES